MKKGVHPDHRPVVFRDPGRGHLFCTGRSRVLVTAGRVQRFDQRNERK
jgi:ribosomal protein L31